MKCLGVAVILSGLFAFNVHAVEPIRIDIGKNYEKYSNEELRKRVFQLERAVAQLQDQVFQLAIRGNGAAAGSGNWNCHMESFGKTHIAAGNTKASALAQVLKKCGDATNAVHCNESDVKCDNE